MFTHIRHNIMQDLNTIEKNGMRHYVTPDNIILPSVTTVVNFGPKEGLEKWKKRMGPVKSEQIRTLAVNRGNKIHELCESYLNNETIDYKSLMPNIKSCFVSIKPFLNQLNNIRCLESCLYSERIGLAGRVDCIAECDGELIVVDFKGSNKEKELKNIRAYCLQACAYAQLYEDMTDIHISKASIIVAVELTSKSQIFQINVDDYKSGLFDIIKQYNESLSETSS